MVYKLTDRVLSAVYSIVWVLLWRPPETLSRMAILHDMARNPRQLCYVQYPPLILLHVPRPDAIARAIFLLLLGRVVLLVLGTWLPIHCSQRFQFCLLDCPKQRCCQPGIHPSFLRQWRWILLIPGSPDKLFGYNSGLGINFITFDWSMIAYNGSPLVTPW